MDVDMDMDIEFLKLIAYKINCFIILRLGFDQKNRFIASECRIYMLFDYLLSRFDWFIFQENNDRIAVLVNFWKSLPTNDRNEYDSSWCGQINDTSPEYRATADVYRQLYHQQKNQSNSWCVLKTVPALTFVTARKSPCQLMCSVLTIVSAHNWQLQLMSIVNLTAHNSLLCTAKWTTNSDSPHL
jgi:hypothetical protein